jgi:hypothetical protein
MKARRNDPPVIEATTPIGAAPETVYDHLVMVEGIGFVDHIAQDDGRRAMALVSPDAQGETLLTVIVESSEDPRVAARLESVVRSELNRLARILHEQRVPAGSDDIGLDAIRLDLEHGAREAPLDQTNS